MESWSDLDYQEERRAVMVAVSGDGSVITDRSSDKPPPAPSTSGVSSHQQSGSGPVPPSAVGASSNNTQYLN